jgi:XRE family transcriptional regulator, regulator of sulfur utilization
MISRRDCIVALIAFSTTLATVAWAQSSGRPILHSSLFDWEEAKAEETPTGAKRNFFVDQTATLDRLSCHATTVNAGQASHPPHKHVEEELIIIKEGTFEVMQNGTTTEAGPGSVIFEASNEMHGLRNVGDTPGTYFVVKFWPPGMLEEN